LRHRTLFFTFTVIISAAVVSAMPKRLLRARYPLANLMSIGAVLIMVMGGLCGGGGGGEGRGQSAV
jgi:hypothetical protein